MEKQANDSYFEQQVKQVYGAAPEEHLIQRISDCSMVTDRLSADPVWAVVIADAKNWVTRLDSTWQEIKDPMVLNQARILKTAYLHIASLPRKYEEDLKMAQKELETRGNVEDAIIKDYDTE